MNSLPYLYNGIETQVEGVDPLAGSVVRSVKVEYQPRLGPEVCSPSQLAREWVSSLVRPSSKLVRLRYYLPSNRRSSSWGGGGGSGLSTKFWRDRITYFKSITLL